MALQVILVQFGNTVFHCCERGLTGKQWGICIGFSAITFVVSIICKLIPLEKCIQPILDKYGGDDEEEEEGEGEANKVEKKEKVVNKKNNNNSNFESIDSSIKIKINKNADREIYNVIVESDSSKENNQVPQSDNKKLTIKEKKELIE
jgi:hypothetical protein